MKSTTYAKGTPVTVPPCAIHAAQHGVILSRHVLRARDSKPIIDYWIRFEDGELCLHPHHELRETVQAVECLQEALLVVH